MSVKTASELVARMMRVAIKETISPANQGFRNPSKRPSLSETAKVTQRLGKELHQQVNAYTGSVDEFGCPGNTVDRWRLHLSHRDGGLEAANSIDTRRERRG